MVPLAPDPAQFFNAVNHGEDHPQSPAPCRNSAVHTDVHPIREQSSHELFLPSIFLKAVITEPMPTVTCTARVVFLGIRASVTLALYVRLDSVNK